MSLAVAVVAVLALGVTPAADIGMADTHADADDDDGDDDDVVPVDAVPVSSPVSSPDDREALVKWGGGLGYEDATWEPVGWVASAPGGDAAMRAYRAVQARREIKAAAARGVKDGSTIQSVEDDADLAPSRELYGNDGDVLRGYQRDGVRWMAHNLVVRERG